MDSLTQAALGAAIGQSFLGKRIGNKAAAVGAIVATIPDLDVLFLPFFSDIDRLSIHRGFSHSIVFSILGAVLLTLALKRIKWTKEIAWQRLSWVLWLVLITHMILDAFTTYGTQLLLPFSDARIGLDSINVVDPVYTVPLLIGLVLSLWIFRKRERSGLYNNWGLVISTGYLLTTLIIKQSVENRFQQTLLLSDIKYEKLLTVPVGMSSINWYGVAKTKDGIHLGKYSWTDSKGSIDLTYFPTNEPYLKQVDSELVSKMKWFAKDYYVVAKDSSGLRFYNLQCDMQGIQNLGNELAPTAFYFKIESDNDGVNSFSTQVH